MKTKTVLVLLFTVVASLLRAQTGARYLIITHDNFYDAVQPLAEWKTKKGMLCRTVRTSETGTANFQIRSYIVNAYNTWDPRPECVLLVGAGSYLAAFDHGYHSSRTYMDNDYGDISGDFRAELPCGRLPCRSVRQCSTMVAKVLAYERTPEMVDTLWFRRGTEVIRDYGDSDSATYWSDAHFVADLAHTAGYSSLDSLCSSRGQNSWNVVHSVNGGTSFVLYRGTGTSNWYDPFAVDPSQTTNGNRLPIVCSFTCQTVSVSPYSPGDSMIANAWLATGTPPSLNGAVAFIGNTHSGSQLAQVRSAMTHGFFSGVFTESLQHLGNAVLRGKLQIYNQFGSAESLEYEGFTLIGDPELDIWTAAPQPLQVNYPRHVPFGVQNFTVQVIRDIGVPVGNALVCIRSDSGIYQYGCTDGAGTKTFSINPTVEETMEVTVTARNCVPHEGWAEIRDPGAVAEPKLSVSCRPSAVSHLNISPSPGRGHFALSAVPNSFVTIYRPDGARVWSAIVPSCGQVVWSAEAEPAGIYVARTIARDGAQTSRTFQIVE
jgi:hypothetical protein